MNSAVTKTINTQKQKTHMHPETNTHAQASIEPSTSQPSTLNHSNTESTNPTVSDSDPQSKMTAADFESDLQPKMKTLNSNPRPMPGYCLTSASIWLIGSTRLAPFLEPCIPELAI